MAFPYLSEAGFEDGTRGHFDAETDTESRLDFPHYTTLAALPGKLAPFSGAYCCRVTLANDGSPADAYVQETGSWDTALDGTISFRFAFFLSSDAVMANNDEFAIFQLWSGASTAEAGVYINYTTANGFRVGIGETSASSFKPLTLNAWHVMEMTFVIDDGGSNDGTIDAWLDGSAFTQVASLDQAAITSGVFGVVGQDAGTTTGTLLLDDIIADDARIGPILERFPQERVITQSGHLFIGPGSLDGAALLSTTAGNTLTLFDTDAAETTDAQSFKVELAIGAATAAAGPITFDRGCYAVLAGTNPRGWASYMRASDGRRGVRGPEYYSAEGIRMWGRSRQPRRPVV